MKTRSEIKAVKESVEKEILAIPGVTGVDIQEKEKDGKKTGELAIQVYVKQKKPLSKLKNDEKIPKSIDGVKTDVKEEEFFAHLEKMSLEEYQKLVDATKHSTLQGGISIGPCRSIGGFIFVGTLGCIVNDNSSSGKMMLSNFHVMSVDNTWNQGDTIAQPARNDGGNCPSDVVGTLQRATLNSDIDAAVASISGRPYSCKIKEIGKVKGKNAAAQNMAVRKRGRTTELTYGNITSTNLSVNVNYDSLGVVTLFNQIRIEVDSSQSSEFGLGGDSGSVVVDNNNKVVGLYFAGNSSGSIGIANHIDPVLTGMDVKIHKCLTIKPPKSLKQELKENAKEFHKGERKEFKDLSKVEIKEKKEFKEWGKGEFKEKKEFKEFKKEWGKDFKEKDKDLVEEKLFENTERPLDPIDRLRNIEDAVKELSHFIQLSERPDLSYGALNNEEDE